MVLTTLCASYILPKIKNLNKLTYRRVKGGFVKTHLAVSSVLKTRQNDITIITLILIVCP